MVDDELARIRNQEVGFVFQTFNLLASRYGPSQCGLPLIYGGIPGAKRHEMAKQALAPSISRIARYPPSERARAVNASVWQSRGVSKSSFDPAG
jgi:putative ABC transport system ATP-binding protein